MRNIENTLKIRIEEDATSTFIVIVPTDSVCLHRQRELVDYHPNQAVANLRVYTLASFIQRLYDQVQPPRMNISQGIQNLWLHEIANPQSNDPNFHHQDTFRPSQNIPVPDSTISLVADTINRLKEYGEDTLNSGNGESQNPTEDGFIRIYKDYETKLKDRWIDEQGKRLYLANAKNFGSLMIGAFPKADLVVVEGFTMLSKADTKILTHVAEMSQIEMWFRTDWLEGNEGLYKNITELISQFKNSGAYIDPDYQREPDRHQHYANNLFRMDNSCVTPIEAPHIQVLKPADRSEEVMQIAHLIQKHVSDGSSKLSKICVACYNIGLYQDRIAEIFPAYRIPYSLGSGTPLTKSEVVKSIFLCISSDQPLLNDIYFPEVKSASNTRQFHPVEFQEYIEGLVKSAEVIQRILNPMFGRDLEVVEAEVEAYCQFNRILRELCSVLMSEGVRSDFLRNYIDKLRRVAKHTSYRNTTRKKGETVRIVQLSDLGSQKFDIVFLGDFVEGNFPENYRPDPLLPNHSYRTEDVHLYNNRFMFYGALKAFRKRLYLLAPQREREAELIPSPFLQQLRAVADVKTLELKHPEQGSVPGFLSTYGRHIWTADTPADTEFPDGLEHMHTLINHVVNVEKSREETHKHLAYEGLLAEGPLSTESRERLKKRQHDKYSITDLETYAKCPFQYFTRTVLNLHIEDDEEGDELSSIEKGLLLHKVLFIFYNNLRHQEALPFPQYAEDEFEKAKLQLYEVLLSISGEEKDNKRFTENPIGENNLFWLTDIAKLHVALRKWIEAERACELPLTPSYFEVNFGQSGDPKDSLISQAEPIRIGNVRMRGKIDRIDANSRTFNVIDYKTGRSTIRMSEILNGRSLQLPIYLQAAEKLLKKLNKTELKPAAGLYHKIRLDQCAVELGIGKKSLNEVAFEGYKNKEWKKIRSNNGQLLEDPSFAQILERVKGYVQQYVKNISEGNFPLITRVKTFPPPEEGGSVDIDEYGFVDSEEHGDKPLTPHNKTQPCNYCNYKRICRVGAISESSQLND